MIYLVIVCYNSEYWLERCLQTIYSSIGDLEVRCLLVDNGQMEGAYVRKLEFHFPQLVYHVTGRNLFYGGGNNLGIEKALLANAKYIGLINPDTWFPTGWLQKLLQCFESFPDYGILAPLQYDYEHPGKLADWTDGVFRANRVKNLSRCPVELPYVEGSCLFIRSNVVEAIGAFDLLFEMYYEEIDLCRRARFAGFRVGVCTESIYHHYSSRKTTDTAQRLRNLRISLSQLVYILTDPDCLWSRNLYHATEWTIKRLLKTLPDSNFPSFKFVTGTIGLLMRKHGQLKTKWIRDRILLGNSGYE